MKKTAQAFSVAIIGALTLGGAAEFARAECYVQAPLRPVHRSYIRRDVVEPGVYEIGRRPGAYGWTGQAVGQPGGVIWHEEPSVYRTVQVRVRQRGGSVWREQCINGQAGVCRVHVPPTYITAEKRILVKRGRRWAERVPGSVDYVERRVLLRPYKNYAHFQRPYIAFSREHLTIQPEGSRWVRASAKPDC
jgi:hypothetical protein